MYARAILNVGKANSRFSNRQFGALTQKSWTTNETKPVVRSTNSNDTVNNSDILLESLFSRSVPLPHANLQQQINASIGFSQVNASPVNSILDPESDLESLQTMNRNARRPKKANRGARPCSRAARRAKKEKIGKRRR